MMSRPESATGRTTNSIWWASAILVLLGAVAVYGFVASSGPAVLASTVCAVILMFLVPRNALPAAALWLLVLLPVGYMYIPKVLGQYFAPSVLVIGIWMLRLAFAHRMIPLLRMPLRGWLISGPFLFLFFASALGSKLLPQSLGWGVVFTVCVIAPSVLGQICLDDVWPTVRRTFAGIGLFLGVLAASDFVFHFNPWTQFYRYEFLVRAGVFSTFRAFTSLGHPLVTSLVASVALVICVFPTGAAKRWFYWLGAIGATTALILSVSRSGVFAVGLAVIIGVLSGLVRSRQRSGDMQGRLGVVLITTAISAAVAWSPLLRRRNESAESVGSANYRSASVDKAMVLIGERPVLGFGPGTSPWVFGDRFRGPLENSALQLIVSLGIPAFLMLTLGICIIIAVAMRRTRAGAAAGIVAFSVSVVGCNAIDSGPAILGFITPLIVCAVMPQGGRPEQIASWPGCGDRTEDQRNTEGIPSSAA